MTPGQAKRKHIKSLVGAVATGGYFNGTAPMGTASPFVIVDELGAEDVMNGMGSPGATEFEPRVYAESDGETFPSAQAEAIFEALNKATTTQGDWEVYSYRLRPYEDAGTTDSGRQFRREGGDYRVIVRPFPQP